MKPRDEYFSRGDRYSLGIDEESGRHYLAIPVTARIADYEEYYELSLHEYERLLAEAALAVAFAEECRHREHDDLLMHQPGWNRGTPM